MLRSWMTRRATKKLLTSTTPEQRRAAMLANRQRVAATLAAQDLVLPPDDVLQQVCDDLHRYFGPDSATFISLITEDRQYVVATANADASGPIGEIITSPEGVDLSWSMCQFVVANAEPLLVENAKGHPLLSMCLAKNIGAYGGAPIYFRGEPIGAVGAAFAETRRWPPEDEPLLERIAEQVGHTLASR